MKKLIALVLIIAILCSFAACTNTAPAQSILYGKYLCYMINDGGNKREGCGEWLLLEPGGKGRLYITKEADIEWELADVQSITVTAPDGQYQGMVYPSENEIMLAKGNEMLFFSLNGRNRDTTGPVTEESLQIPYTEPTETDAPTEMPTEIDYSSAYVTDFKTDAFTFDGENLEYHIPEIIFDAEGIDYLNMMLFEQIYEDVYLKNVKGAIEDYGMPGVAFIVYQWGRSENFLSIVVTITPYASEGAEFSIYNVDLSSGQLASQSEVLAHFGYTVESFSDRARAVMGSVVMDQYASLLDDPSLQAEFDDLMLRTTSEEYVSDATPFVGSDGNLWMVAPIASIAGADRYLQVIPFTTYPISDAFLDGA